MAGACQKIKATNPVLKRHHRPGNKKERKHVMDDTTKAIAMLNDLLRTTFNPAAGRIVTTQGIGALPQEDQSAIFNLVKTFNDFSEDNDPYGEHDFGEVEHNGKRAFWKIDYYDTTLQWGSPDPTDPELTRRVMTVMLANEY